MSLLANSNAIETGGYQISRSVRLRSSASAYFNRTPASAGNRQTWTWSGWLKLGTLSSGGVLFAASSDGTTSNRLSIQISTANVIDIRTVTSGTTTILREATAVLRDVSAWYHLVVAFDTTQATANNRLSVYINGVQQTAFTTLNNLSQNTDSYINNNIEHRICNSFGAIYFDGYLTEINFIDGQALTPSSFGETDANTGVWVAKKYNGTYGTNGFYLNFSDNSAATSTTIGKDYSGNGNNWTPNNISVTAGTTYDSMLDVPSGSGYADGGNGRGNYATFNPTQAAGTYAATFADGNLKVTSNASSAGQTSQVTTIAFPATGNWYAEVTAENVAASSQHLIGIVDETYNPASASDNPFTRTAIGYGYNNDGNKRTNSTNTAYGATWTTGNVIGIHLNNGTLTFYKDGTTQGSAFTGLTGNFYFAVAGYNSDRYVLNAGQRAFAATPPSGAKALNTTNLPDPTVKKGSSYFDVVAYSGNGSSPRNVVTNLAFQPDFAWLKCRNAAYNHTLFDSVRGAGSTKGLSSNVTDAEGLGGSASATSQYGYVSAFNSDGIQVTTGSIDDLYVNDSSATYVAWNWKANGAGVSNTAGTITSTVSANTTAGFSIVTYTGTGANATVGHGLGVAPSMIIIKARGSVASGNWTIYNKNIGATKYLYLNSTIAASTFNHFQNTDPTSSLFYVVNDGNVNQSSIGYVAYCFAPISGYSAFGSFVGNGTTDNSFVYLGFRPKLLLMKPTTSVSDWIIVDSSRDTYNVAINLLNPNLSGAEYTSASVQLDFLSNGFKVRGNWAGFTNTPIYAAFAESPFKFSNAR